jgi:2-polyprenyl-6-methoxyphenol hydroxylase-like FAD-dependent oxidoreductase
MEPVALVVGAGPVGLTMAVQLARYGVPVRMVEKKASRTDKSKALVVWSRTLELMDAGGYGPTFVRAGFKVTSAGIYANGSRVAHIRLDQMQTPHPYALMIPQSESERLLEEQLGTLDVKVERQVELLRFAPGPERVATALRRTDGKEENVEVAWLIGCDGAHSTVRHGLAVQFEGDTLESDWILADVHLSGLGDIANEVSTYWHSEGVLAIFPISPGRYRVIADVGDAGAEQRQPDPTVEGVQAVVDRRGPSGLKVTAPIWLASFRINERKVKDYRAGRVFLAGDAAHIHSPAGGQGMNTGMQDAFNFSWKLAWVYHGLAAAEPLLGSYSAERSAVGEQVLKDAGRLTAMATTRSRAWQYLRNHVASFAFGLSPVRHAMAEKLTELSIGYWHSPLTAPPGCGHPRPVPGERAPLSGEIKPSAIGTPPRFTLFAKPDAECDGVIQRHCKLLEPDVPPPFHDGHLWLVRPDGYVALAADDRDWAAIDQYLMGICGRK